MGLLKKKTSPYDLGKVLYTNVRYVVMSPNTRFHQNKLFQDIREDPENLKLSNSIEVLILFMYIIFETLTRRYPSSLSLEVMKGVDSEFMNHMQPILKPGLDMITIEQVVKLIDNRFDEYGECLRNKTGAGPAWHLGVKAYWNIIGQEKEDPAPVLVLSAYSANIMEFIENILNDYKIKE